jgi:Ca2+-transporting ATPase
MSRLLHAIPVEEAIEELKTSTKGLSSEEADKRLQEYGSNELQTKKKVTALEILLHQFKDIFVIMLIFATVIAFYVDTSSGEPPIDAIIIAVIVILNSIIGFIQEYKSEKAMEAMKSLTAPKARLLRDGKETTVAAREVVPGDILLLEAGDRIAADGRLIETIDLRTDEAILTGESNPIDKDLAVLKENASLGDRTNSVFTATFVTYGRGRAIVTSTGMKTEFGKIAETVQSVEEEEPPLQVKLDKFAKKIAILVVMVCALVFVL